MPASNALTTRISDETAKTFHERREALELSTNQYLKLLVLRDQGEALDLTAFKDLPKPVAHKFLTDWLRGQ